MFADPCVRHLRRISLPSRAAYRSKLPALTARAFKQPFEILSIYNFGPELMEFEEAETPLASVYLPLIMIFHTTKCTTYYDSHRDIFVYWEVCQCESMKFGPIDGTLGLEALGA